MDIMKRCLKLLNEKTGVLSNFRGASQMATVSMLCLSTDPEWEVEQMLTAYGDLKEVFRGSEYLAMTAIAIARFAEPSQYQQTASKTREIYNRLSDVLPFLTSVEDSTFAVLLALSGLDDLYIEQEIERCYTILKPSFFSGKSLSHVLALGNEQAEGKCRKALELFTILKSHGHKYGTDYELATLGVLALINIDTDVLVNEMIWVDAYLKKQKGFGAFGIGSQQRLMYADMLVTNDHIPEAQTMQTAALNGIISLAIAQQVAIYASVTAASSAALSSSSFES